ncbi:MAG: carboxypeptidase-like regulatory domain-containing protein [Candidatus Nanohaloarchaea archaeon]|nr:carboxypeptidase-like regulatory domain-containing protein [Candidatus Nanohaloarchaea archaeon]
MSRHLSEGRSSIFFAFALAFFVLLLPVFVMGATQNNFGVDDHSFFNTSTDGGMSQTANSYSIEVAFINHSLNISGTTGSHIFNITGPSGGTVVDGVRGNESLQTNTSSVSSQGRHYVYNESSNSREAMDLFTFRNNVTGRIKPSGSPGFSPGKTPTVSIRYWLNGSEIKQVSSVSQLNGVSAREFAYRYNTSRNKFWIQVEAPGYATTAAISRNISVESGGSGGGPGGGSTKASSIPFIKDFQLSSSKSKNLSIRLVEEPSPKKFPMLNDTALRVRVKASTNVGGRMPYFQGPPVKTVTTQNGWANFSYLSTGQGGKDYQVSLVNGTFARSSEPDFTLNSTMDTLRFNVTQNAGNVTGTLKGPNKEGVRYAVAVLNDSIDFFIFPQKSPGKFTTGYIPNGSYQVMAAKIKGGAPNIAVAGNVDVPVNGTVKVGDIGFPAQVKLNGTVVNQTGSPVSGARIFLRNRSKGAFAFMNSDQNGDFPKEADTLVKNDTKYSVTIIPPRGSKYQINKTTVEVRGATTKNFTLGSGKSLEGYITDSGNGVSDVNVLAANVSQDSFSDTTTNGTGYYKLQGLRQVNHSIHVYPPAGKAEIHDKVWINSSSNRMDFTLSGNNANLTGLVRDTNGNSLDSTVTLKDDSSSVSVRRRATTTTSSGRYTFNRIPNQVSYTITVNPSNDSFRTRKKSLRLQGNTTVNFNHSQLTTVTGSVTNSSGDGISGAIVKARNSTRDSFDSSGTNSTGGYTLKIPRINHTVEISPPSNTDYTSNTTAITSAEIRSGNKGVGLSSGVSLSGHITNSSKSSPAFSGKIGLRNSSEDVAAFTTFKGGTYSLSGLRNISYDVWVSVNDEAYKDNTTSLSSIPSGEKNFTVSTPSGRKLKVSVQDNSTSEVIANATVIAGSQQGTSDSNGEVLFGRQTTGDTFTVRANKDGYRGASKQITMKSKTQGSGGLTDTAEFQNVTLNLVNKQGSLLEADINVTKNGNLQSGATVIFSSNKSGVSQASNAVTGTNGRATLTDLIKGGYNVLLVIGPNKQFVDSVSIAENNQETLNMSSSKFNVGLEGVSTQ